jgi:hypothetical protein
MRAESAHCVVTSPPYWGLRDYGVDGQLGLESTLEEYIATMVGVFREVRRVSRPDGTLWLNMGDGYAGGGRGGNPEDRSRIQASNLGSMVAPSAIPENLKPKDLLGMPWRLALALQADGWWLRCDIIWHKPNPMPESCTDRPTKAHEYLFLLTKAPSYFYDAEAIREDGPTYTRRAGGYKQHHEQGASRFGGKGGFGDSDVTTVGRNKRSVWEIPTQAFSKALHHGRHERPRLLSEVRGTMEAGSREEAGADATGSQQCPRRDWHGEPRRGAARYRSADDGVGAGMWVSNGRLC